MTHETLSTLQTLTLSEFREQLKQRGIAIGLSTLSELISDGDIAEQLGAQRKGNRLLFPPDAVDALAAFIPLFRESPNFKNSARPDALRSFLNKTGETATGAVIPVSSTISDFHEMANLGAQIVAAMQQAGLFPRPDDALLTIAQAHAAYGLPVPMLRELRIKVGQRYKVKRSACLRQIQKL